MFEISEDPVGRAVEWVRGMALELRDDVPEVRWMEAELWLRSQIAGLTVALCPDGDSSHHSYVLQLAGICGILEEPSVERGRFSD